MEEQNTQNSYRITLWSRTNVDCTHYSSSTFSMTTLPRGIVSSKLRLIPRGQSTNSSTISRPSTSSSIRLVPLAPSPTADTHPDQEGPLNSTCVYSYADNSVYVGVSAANERSLAYIGVNTHSMQTFLCTQASILPPSRLFLLPFKKSDHYPSFLESEEEVVGSLITYLSDPANNPACTKQVYFHHSHHIFLFFLFFLSLFISISLDIDFYSHFGSTSYSRLLFGYRPVFILSSLPSIFVQGRLS